MKITFDINLNSGHLFRFYMYQAYTGMQGIVSVILCILGFIMAGISAKSGHMANTMMYLVFGLVFLLYVPGALYMRSKSNLKKNQVLANRKRGFAYPRMGIPGNLCGIRYIK